MYVVGSSVWSDYVVRLYGLIVWFICMVWLCGSSLRIVCGSIVWCVGMDYLVWLCVLYVWLRSSTLTRVRNTIWGGSPAILWLSLLCDWARSFMFITWYQVGRRYYAPWSYIVSGRDWMYWLNVLCVMWYCVHSLWREWGIPFGIVDDTMLCGLSICPGIL